MRSIGIIILAAGGSRRMGQPKQLLPWKGSTLLRHVCETALAVALGPVVVVLGNEARACINSLEGLDLIFTVNPQWERGMGSSVSKGIQNLESRESLVEGAIVMLADQPFVNAEMIGSLVAAWSPPDWPIAATSYGETAGVPALFDRIFFPQLRALNDDKGARALIARERQKTRLISFTTELIDIDTPESYQSAASRIGPIVN